MPRILWAFLLLLSVSALAQDVVKANPNAKILVENADVRVVQDTIPPGAKSALHSHPAGWAYVTKPGVAKVTYADGKTETWEAKAGDQQWMDAERPHTTENIGKTTLQYVLVEVKSAGKPAAKPAAKPAKK